MAQASERTYVGSFGHALRYALSFAYQTSSHVQLFRSRISRPRGHYRHFRLSYANKRECTFFPLQAQVFGTLQDLSRRPDRMGRYRETH